MDIARQGIGLARRVASEASRAEECAVAFSLNGDLDTPENEETIQLLARVLEEEPPALILVETLPLVYPSTYETVERLLDTGLPFWLSFRRCRHGVCGVFGEHWGGPEGDGRLRPGCTPVRSIGCRGVVGQLHSTRPCAEDAAVTQGLHRPDMRRIPQPRLSVAGLKARPAFESQSAPTCSNCARRCIAPGHSSSTHSSTAVLTVSRES